MPSRIDVTGPEDGRPASKAAQRDNWRRAKAELEHGGFFRQAHAAAVERTTEAKLRDSICLLDFIPPAEHSRLRAGTSDYDAGEAIRRAIETAVEPSTTWFNCAVYVPAGRYPIRSSGVFSYNPTGVLQGPIRWIGDGMLSTLLVLEPARDEDHWFYDSSPAQAYTLHGFTALSFEAGGPFRHRACGFRIVSHGHEQFFRFVECGFGLDFQRGSRLAKAFLLEGRGNGDKISFHFCMFLDIHDYLMKIDNNQAVQNVFVGCVAERIRGDVFVVDGNNGGGAVQVYGGSWIWGWDAEEMKYLLRVRSGENTKALYLFSALRPELSNPNTFGRAGLLRREGEAGYIDAVFDACDLSSGEGIYPPFEGLVVDARTRVFFRHSRLHSDMTYRIAGTSPAGHRLEEPGTIGFEGCAVPDDLSGKVRIESRCGRAYARGCYRSLLDAAAEPEAADFDLGWREPARSARTVREKIAVLKAPTASWPSGADGEAGALAVRLPAGAVVTAVQVYKPATRRSAAPYRLHVGNGDRSVTYASSAAGRFDDPHLIDLVPPPDRWIRTAADPVSRTVRLWAEPAGDGTAEADLPGEIAVVRYL